MEEMKARGAMTLIITNNPDAVVRESTDLLVELKLEIPECARLAGYFVSSHLLGLHTGLKKAYEFDNPRILSRAIILNTEVRSPFSPSRVSEPTRTPSAATRKLSF